METFREYRTSIAISKVSQIYRIIFISSRAQHAIQNNNAVLQLSSQPPATSRSDPEISEKPDTHNIWRIGQSSRSFWSLSENFFNRLIFASKSLWCNSVRRRVPRNNTLRRMDDAIRILRRSLSRMRTTYDNGLLYIRARNREGKVNTEED